MSATPWLLSNFLSPKDPGWLYDDDDDDDDDHDGDACWCIRETIHVSNLLISARSGNVILISLIMATQSAGDKPATTSDVCMTGEVRRCDLRPPRPQC